jgi:ABC-type multidrug transport system permease subunit
MICPKCGAQNMDGVTFCGSCGAQLESHNPSTPEEPQQKYNQPPVQQPQYQQQQAYSGGQSNAGMTPPKNYMTEAIIVTIISFLCCSSIISLILGIIAIVKANNVNMEFLKGNYDVAGKNANTAKTLTIWAAIVAVIQFILIVILIFVLVGLGVSLGGLDEILKDFS